MSSGHNRKFLSAWLRNPIQIGALLPSGSGLARAMAAQVVPGQGTVVELGTGTGVITRALLARGLAAERLVLVEKDPLLFAGLERRFPNVAGVCGDAARLKKLLSRAGVGCCSTLVSSLPLLSMHCLTRLRVLSQIFGVLDSCGTLVQFTYSPLPPIPDALTRALGVSGTRVARVLCNLPPAAVWVYTKQKKGEAVELFC